MLNPARVRVFFEVARHNSFSRAAEELSYTPSAVSHQIAALERELGLALINRAGRPWTLTEAGELLLRRAESALGELAAAEDELAAFSSTAAGRVRLSSGASGLRSVVPPAAAAFKATHPGVELLLSETQAPEVLRELRAGTVDVGLIVVAGGRSVPRSRRIQVTPLLEQGLLVAVPSAGDLADAPHLTLRQLRRQRWLLPSPRRVPEFRSEIDELFEKAGYRPTIALELDDDVTAASLVAAGIGIGLVPGLAAPVRHPEVATVPLHPKQIRSLHMVTLAGRHSEPVRTLLDALQQAASTIRASQPAR